jgi:hypothetical protein
MARKPKLKEKDMRNQKETSATTRSRCALAISALALATTAALAQQQTRQTQQQPANADGTASQHRSAANQSSNTTRNDRQLMESWSKLKGELVEANELLSADVTNGFNPVGQVTDLILTPDHRQVQYVLYETPYPWSLWGAADGFARYEGLEIENGPAFDTTLRLEADDAAGAPEQLELTRDQARERLVSRVIGSPMVFTDDATREIEDILLDRDTGAVIHYVIETDEDSVFRTARRTVPAARVSIADDGRVTAALRLREVDEAQIYDPALL